LRNSILPFPFYRPFFFFFFFFFHRLISRT
jgi:hypothetical protein